MSNFSLAELLGRLRATHFRDLNGTKISALLPISEQLVNQVVAGALPPALPLRDVHVQPVAGNAFSVKLTPRSTFLPAITVRLDVVQQPDFPRSPVLVLRLATMGGLFAFAGAAFNISSLLPRGVRLDADRVLVDLGAIAAEQQAADLLEHVTRLHVNTEDGRVVVSTEIAVG